MKHLWALLPPFIKAILSVIVFVFTLGWGAYGAVYLIVKAEGKGIKEEVMNVRKIDMEHLDKRFDKLEQLIKEQK
jgi:hypothetical protein